MCHTCCVCKVLRSEMLWGMAGVWRVSSGTVCVCVRLFVLFDFTLCDMDRGLVKTQCQFQDKIRKAAVSLSLSVTGVEMCQCFSFSY